jgi:hypothetical protein
LVLSGNAHGFWDAAWKYLEGRCKKTWVILGFVSWQAPRGNAHPQGLILVRGMLQLDQNLFQALLQSSHLCILANTISPIVTGQA